MWSELITAHIYATMHHNYNNKHNGGIHVANKIFDFVLLNGLQWRVNSVTVVSGYKTFNKAVLSCLTTRLTNPPTKPLYISGGQRPSDTFAVHRRTQLHKTTEVGGEGRRMEDGRSIRVDWYPRCRDMTVPRLWSYVDHTQTTRPTVVFIDIGTNDLSVPTYDPLTLAQDIVDIARCFGDYESVRHVSISEMLRRNDNRRPNFNLARMETIMEMRWLVCEDPNIHTCHHRGLTQDWQQHLREDGVHLNQGGTCQYIMNVWKEARHWANK